MNEVTANPLVSVFDVAQFILLKRRMCSTMKLQKLVYYSQAWSLVWDDSPLFHERIEAWINGPVVRELYERHRGLFQVTAGNLPGNPNKLSEEQGETVDVVLDFYAEHSTQWLSDLTHDEDPWKRARKRGGLLDNQRGSEEITLEDMSEYYSSLRIGDEEEV